MPLRRGRSALNSATCAGASLSRRRLRRDAHSAPTCAAGSRQRISRPFAGPVRWISALPPLRGGAPRLQARHCRAAACRLPPEGGLAGRADAHLRELLPLGVSVEVEVIPANRQIVEHVRRVMGLGPAARDAAVAIAL